MESDSMGSLLLKLSVPAMIGMIVNALYNFVDTIFVGQGVGPLAIAGLSIAFPIQLLIGAFAQTFGIGSASIISRRLGEKNEQAAACAAGNAISATVITSFIFMILGLIFIKPMLMFFGATVDVLPYAYEYVSIILLGAVFLSLTMTSNGIIRAEGQAKVAMTVMIIGTGLNIIFDPIFIFVFHLGIKGVAIA
ncbi:MAG: MATE family efflux transporter, partial [Spirochaetia bacterium]|nr:MATE family efflux transporter [Spirochaetia bacterium]